jgi:hypothetical protein
MFRATSFERRNGPMTRHNEGIASFCLILIYLSGLAYFGGGLPMFWRRYTFHTPQLGLVSGDSHGGGL